MIIDLGYSIRDLKREKSTMTIQFSAKVNGKIKLVCSVVEKTLCQMSRLFNERIGIYLMVFSLLC